MNKLSVRSSSFMLGLLSLLFVFGASTTEGFAQDGEKLYKSYCAACHSSGTAQLVGPGLAGATERHDKEWLHKWVKDSQALIKSGDDKAVSLYEEYNKIMMPAQPLSNEQIEVLFAWVDELNDGGGSDASGSEAPAAGASKSTASDAVLKNGEKLYKSYCAACHSSGTAQLVGPGLAGATERHDKEWLYKWVKDSQALIKSGDDKAVSLYEEYNKIMMPAQPVSDEEIDAIFAFVDAQASAGGAAASSGGAASQGGVATSGGDENKSDHSLYIVLASILGLLVIISILRTVQYSLTVAESRKNGEEAPEQVSMWNSLSKWVQQNKTIVALIGIVLFIFIGKLAWNAMMDVGIYTNYEPEQPIKFSHKLHAGDNGIDCQYCHSTASFSKTAGIPPASTCMNCHTYISEGPVYGKEEIAKIYAALDFDPATKTYGPNKKPIKWVKVHNLPDFVYFNHSQHVTLGKIACQKCHGPVETFTVGKQFAPLTMGWCVDCHRSTKVQMKDNGYYDEIHKRLPEKLRKQYLKDGTITVAELGGIECGKCHY